MSATSIIVVCCGNQWYQKTANQCVWKNSGIVACLRFISVCRIGVIKEIRGISSVLRKSVGSLRGQEMSGVSAPLGNQRYHFVEKFAVVFVLWY